MTNAGTKKVLKSSRGKGKQREEETLVGEVFEETLRLAEESEATSCELVFATFMRDYLPAEYLERIESSIGASLSDIWKDRYEIVVSSSGTLSEASIDIDDGTCEICERFVSRTKHHLIPKEMHRGLLGRFDREELGKTVNICRMCHSTVHRFFTNEELARHYNSIDALLSDEKMYRYASWASKQPSGGGTRRTL